MKGPDRVKAKHVIDAWILKADKEPTVGVLIAACELLDQRVGRLAIAKKYKELLDLGLF